MKDNLGKKELHLSGTSGSALAAFLFISFIAVSIFSAVIVINSITSLNISGFSLGNRALFLAEGSIENAILRILRNPNYVGETLTVDGDSVVVTVSGGATKTIISQATVGDYVRKVKVTGVFSGGTFAVSSWEEID